ncbi:MAG: helix-turn-helix domain-containing protein [Acidimicrobiales bacterium]
MLARFVRRRRRELGLRQDELAALAGVSTRFLSSLEGGKPGVRLTLVLAVLAQLGTDLELVPGTGTVRDRDEGRS